MKDKTNNQEVEKLTEEYVRSETPANRRELETKLLEITLWKVSEQRKDNPFAVYSESEIRILSEAIKEENSEASRLVRRPFIAKL